MKNLLTKFAGQVLSREQMRAVKGGVVYCSCNGQFIGFPDQAYPQSCESLCSGSGGGSGCEHHSPGEPGYIPGC